MRILVSNDDGVHSMGLKFLAESLRDIAEIVVMAPDKDHSGASNSLTLRRPIYTRVMENGFICVEGTPTDCVHLAVTGYLKKLPDMVVSGINLGPNLGDDVLYSGTVAAAMEGRFLGIPAIAISLVNDSTKNKDYKSAAIIAKKLVKIFIKKSIKQANTILNVNIPNLPLKKIRGYKITRLGSRHIAKPSIKMKDPRGNDAYWIGEVGLEADAGNGTDFHAISRKKVSVTPLHTDLTYYSIMDNIKNWIGYLNESTF